MQAKNLNRSQAEKKQQYLKKNSTYYKIYYTINEIKYQKWNSLLKILLIKLIMKNDWIKNKK